MIFAGTPEVAVPYLHRFIADGHDVVAVATNPATGQGRRQRAGSPVEQAARELGIEVLKPLRARDPEFIARVHEIAPQICPVVAWGALIPSELLAVPDHGWVNMHYSLLPAWRGAAPVQRALMAGDQRTGVTTFEIVAALDAGPIYRQESLDVAPDETAGDLLGRLTALGVETLAATLDDIVAGRTPLAQPSSGISLAPKVLVSDAKLDWTRPAAELVNLIRGTSPSPGAWSTWRGERFKVLRAQLVAGGQLPPGELHQEAGALLVGTGTTVIQLDEVQAFGRKALPAGAWANGANLDAGERLG